MIDEGLRTLLLAQSSITTLVPSQTVNRISTPSIFVASPGQGANLPYAVIQITGGDSMHFLGDYSETLKKVELDIDCFSRDKTQASAIDEAIRSYLKNYTGAAGASHTIKAVLWDEPSIGYDFPDEGVDTKFHYVSRSYSIHYATP